MTMPSDKVHQLHGATGPSGPVGVVPIAAPRVEGSDGDGHLPPMSERLARLEAAVEGLRRTQDFTLIAVLAVGALLATFMVYGFSRTDKVFDETRVLSERLSALPGEISADLRDLTKTLADSITAAKQSPPQVILMPAPEQAPEAPLVPVPPPQAPAP